MTENFNNESGDSGPEFPKADRKLTKNSALLAGLAYFAVVFAIGFVFGLIRVKFLVPNLGELVSVMLELPVILTLAWLVCRRLALSWNVPQETGPRAAMGGVALILLLAQNWHSPQSRSEIRLPTICVPIHHCLRRLGWLVKLRLAYFRSFRLDFHKSSAKRNNHCLREVVYHRLSKVRYRFPTRIQMKTTVWTLLAAGLGAAIAYVDSRPNWDDTGITALVILLTWGVFGLFSPSGWWLWAIAVGCWIPLLAIARTQNFASAQALLVALIGGLLGMAIGKLISAKNAGTS